MHNDYEDPGNSDGSASVALLWLIGLLIPAVLAFRWLY